MVNDHDRKVNDSEANDTGGEHDDKVSMAGTTNGEGIHRLHVNKQSVAPA